MKGVIGFSASNSFISKAIRWFRKSHVSHTFIIINRGDRLLVLEAGKRQVHITTYDKHYKKGYVELYKPKASDYMIDKAIDTVIAQHLEKPYGYFQLLGFALVSILKRFNIKITNPIGRGTICSEVVLSYLRALKLQLDKFMELDKDTTAPDDLLRIMKASPEIFERIQ